MLFRTILTSNALLLSLVLTMSAHAQSMVAGSAAADEVILEMNQAFKKGNSKRLSALLAQARGHALEPWAAYWELRARLDTAAPA